MDNTKHKSKFFLLFIPIFVIVFIITVRTPRTYMQIPQPRGAKNTCPSQISEQTITPLSDTKHFLVSAFMDQRVKGFDLRIISIFRRDSIQTLYCVFCCAGHLSRTTEASILVHSDHFGFPFGTTSVMCKIPPNCDATHVTLLTLPDGVKTSHSQSWLRIRNKKTDDNKEKTFQFNFTVCISSVFGNYNNVLEFAQSLEMYRLLGVGRVVVYNTSLGPELDRLLQAYSHEGLVEMVQWPIYSYLNPSHGWLFSEFGGDLHYYGQVVKLNECTYRSMDRSRYVLLNDIDEIIMPYQHNDLMSLMDVLQQQHPETGVFMIESHVFPKRPHKETTIDPPNPWKDVPGINILERIYREEPDRNMFHPYKMIIQPRLVEQVSVHQVLKRFGPIIKVPLEVCRMIHCPMSTPKEITPNQHLDTRLWDFKDKLVPRVNEMLKRAGLLSSERQS